MIKVLQAFCLGICCFSIYYLLPMDWGQFSTLPFSYISFLLIIMTLLFISNFFVVSLRLLFLYRQFGYHFKFREAYEACLSGQISNLFFIPFVGAMLGHQSKLSAKNIPSAVIAFTVVYERLFVSIIGIALSLASFILLFKPPLLDYAKNHFRLCEIFIVFGIIMVIFALKGLNKQETNLLKQFVSFRSARSLGLLSLITCVGWLIVSSAFVIGVVILEQSYPTASHVGGGILTSFIASLPVSMNGWGVRELASMKIFGALGITQSKALFVSLCVGISSILAVLLLYASNVAILGKNYAKCRNGRGKLADHDQKYNSPQEAYPQPELPFFLKDRPPLSRASFLPSLMVKNIIGLMGYAVAFLIFFHFQFQYRTYSITLNIADIFAYAALFIYASEILLKSESLPFSLPNIHPFLSTGTVILTISLFFGVMNFGITKWAFISRYLGWFCLLGYFSLGVLCRYYIGDRFSRRIVDILICSITIILLVKHGIYLLQTFSFYKNFLLDANLDGYALNRNAFAFQLMVISLFLFIRCRDDGNKSIIPNIQSLNLGLLLAGVIMTSSRAALISCVFLFLIYALIGTINLRQLIRYAISCGLTLYPLFLLKNLDAALGGASPLAALSFGYNPQEFSTNEHLYTIFQGLQMGWNHPVFGAGLGAFIYNEMLLNNKPLVIHNVGVWLWAECGLIGITALMWFCYSTLKTLYGCVVTCLKKKVALSHDYTFLIGLFTIFLCMGIAHDILYQRIFWFTFGLMILRKKSRYFLTV